MTASLRAVIYPVSGLVQAKAVCSTLLGVAPSVDEPYYVHFNAPDQEVGLDPNGHAKGMAGPIAYWHVEDIKTTLTRMFDVGAVEQQATSDTGGGKLIATVLDADGNVTGLI